MRPYRIAAELDTMFDEAHLSGIGKTEFAGATQIILTDEYAGLCLMYRTVHDGDDEKPDMQTFKNCFYLNAKSTEAPQIVDKNVQPIEDRSELYAGCYGNVSLVFYPYNVSGNKGIGVLLGNIQKIKDGTKLTKRVMATDEFKVIAGGYS